MIQRDSLVVAAGENEVVSCQMAGEAVLLDLRAGVYFGLDPVGAVVWSLMDPQRPVDEILQLLLRRYNVEPQRCEQDLLNLLNQLAQAGLITVSEGSNTRT